MERVINIHKKAIKNIEELIGDFSNALSMELNKERQNDSYVYLISENRLNKKIKGILSDKYSRAVTEINRIAEEIIKADPTPNMKYDRKSIDNIIKSVGESTALQFNRMINSVITAMRFDQIAIRRASNRSNTTMKEGLIRARMSGLLVPKYYFKDRSGRNWTTDAYFKMLVNTLVYSIAREITIEKAVYTNHKEVEVIDTGERISLDDYEEIKSKIFHPNSKKLLKIVEDA